MNFPLLAFSLFLWNLLKIAYMLLTYRLGWIINQDRNYEWNLISHRYTYIYNNVQISFSLRCRRHHHHLLMLFISHSISISESNPSSASSLHIVWYFKLGVECHDGEKIGVQEKKTWRRRRKTREGFNDMKRMKRKRATQQGKSSNIIGAVGMAWGKDTRKKFQHCIINLRFFIFLRNRRSSSSWTENEKRLHREIESATGNRNSWKQKKKLSLLSV